MSLNNLTDPRILYIERNGIDDDKRLPCGHLESEDCDCRQIADEQKEDEAEDERLGW